MVNWAFFLLSCGLSWLFWIPAALSGQDVNTTLWLIPYFLGGFGPSVVGVTIIYRLRGRDGLRDLWYRIVEFRRISIGWYVFIALIFPILFGFSVLLYNLIDHAAPGFGGVDAIQANPIILIRLLLVGIVTGPLAEEPGWRGFALEQLQKRWTPLISSIVLGLIWVIWHIPLFLLNGTTQYQWGIGTAAFWLFVVEGAALSILFTWVYNHNRRSVLSAILLHFAYNFTLGLVYPFSPRFYLYEVTLMCFATLVVVQVEDRRSRYPSSD
jgi:membrane protease YdiL (CAAX protease family)